MTAGRDLGRALAVGIATLALLLAVGVAGAAAAPLLSITEPQTGETLATSSPSFVGTSDDTTDIVNLEIYDGANVSGSPIRSEEVLPSDETWQTSPSPALGDGVYTAVAKQTNGALESGESNQVTFTVDTTTPVVSVDPPETPTADTTPTITGSLGQAAGDVQAVSVEIVEGTVVVSEGSAVVSGSTWSYTPATLPDGAYSVRASQHDGAGHVGHTATVPFSIDTVEPIVTIKAAPAATKDTTPTLTGTLGQAAGDVHSVTVTIYEGSSAEGTPASSGSASVSGSAWSYTSSVLAEGTYTAVARQDDTAGNTGASAATTFTIDTTTPAVTLGALTSPTSDSTPTLGGVAGSAAGDTQTVLVRVYRGSSPEGSIAAEHSVIPSLGAWSYTTPTLSDGTYTARAYQSDSAGNEAASTPSVTFVVDTTAPTVSIGVSPVHSGIVQVTRPTFSGTGGKDSGDDSTVTLNIYKEAETNGPPIQSLAALPVVSGKWTSGSTGPQLSNASYTAVVEQTDAAGNKSTAATAFVVSTSAPEVTLVPAGLVQRGESSLLGASPSFSGSAGTAPEDAASVLLKIYSGTVASGPPVREAAAAVSGSRWEMPTLPPLPDGVYTAQAEQKYESVKTGVSPTLIFTVDADAPHVTLTSPVSGSSFAAGASIPVGGSAGTAEGDSPTVTVQLFSGASVAGQAPLESVSVTASAGRWSTALGGLSPGTYTARAQQQDDVKNLGTSAAVTFTVTAPPGPPGPPVASFVWFPAAPRVGEPVSIVSTSVDPASELTSFAWSLSATGPFSPGGSVMSTSFSTAGAHPVRLSVADAAGRSSTVTQTIVVAPRVASLLQPFPVVRITGSQSARGIRIGRFTVQAPTGARVTVRCRGRGCPAKPQSVIARAGAGKSKVGTVLIVFKRFQRSLRPGAVLEIRVTRAGQIGKYTRFVVRRGKLPARVDTCLSPAGVKPMACPSS